MSLLKQRARTAARQIRTRTRTQESKMTTDQVEETQCGLSAPSEAAPSAGPSTLVPSELVLPASALQHPAASPSTSTATASQLPAASAQSIDDVASAVAVDGVAVTGTFAAATTTSTSLTVRGTKRVYKPVPQHLADAAAVLVFDCGYAVPDAVRIVKMPRGGLSKRLQRLCAQREGRTPAPKRPRKSSSTTAAAIAPHGTTALSVAAQAMVTTGAAGGDSSAHGGVPPHIEDAASVLLFDCGYSVATVVEIMKVPWGGLAMRLEHLQAHPEDRQPRMRCPRVGDASAAGSPATLALLPSSPQLHSASVAYTASPHSAVVQTPLASASASSSSTTTAGAASGAPGSDAFVDLLVFPDAALPCKRYHWGVGCARVNCAWVHDQGSSLLELLKLLRGVTATIDLCVAQITCPEIMQAIRAAQARGVTMRVITDHALSLDKSSKVDQFVQKGIPVRFGGEQSPLRHNFCILDGKTLLTGSFNWGLDGVLIHSSELAIHAGGRVLMRYAALFSTLWGRAKTIECESTNLRE